MSTFYSRIEVVDRTTGEVVHVMKMDPPKGERMAERVCDGVERNMDHERFYARICEERPHA